MEGRSKIVAVARRWIGKAYDHDHTDHGWRNPGIEPNKLDDATFICRVLVEARGYDAGILIPDARWLIENLVDVAAPQVGDLVAYGRPAAQRSDCYSVEWHTMIYAGVASVIGACDIAGAVIMRSIEYESCFGWRLLEAAPFHSLTLTGERARLAPELGDVERR